ncbi:hypothetical protein [Aureibacter tunicatorum]|uniref:Uncharacterized protein n=1 Tax=Aureibacter tunicatorum TaxID=866807 RepID=A0AAE3XU30_9BACT|nr:hypothetical protein [Aureibacter tunicatorum]MDR6241876.1 hypothetical protein [Aureibacter tunicatorum]
MINIIHTIDQLPKNINTTISVRLGVVKHLLNDYIKEFHHFQRHTFNKYASDSESSNAIPLEYQQVYLDTIKKEYNNSRKIKLPLILHSEMKEYNLDHEKYNNISAILS